MTAMGHTRHLHDVRAMSACAPTPDMSQHRTNRRNAVQSQKTQRITAFPVYSPTTDVEEWPRREQAEDRGAA